MLLLGLSFTGCAKKMSPAQQESLYALGLKADAENRDADAVRIFRELADQGHLGAQYMLGRAYRFRWGVPERDFKEAIKWYTKSAEQGNRQAQDELDQLKIGNW